MLILKQASQLRQYLQVQRASGKQIGFVPTMGALHEGHLSLIRRATSENDLTVCSIFVNPTQFNNATDFQHYPITVEQDVTHLLTTACDVLFLPAVTEVYPVGYQAPHYDLGALESVLEGAYRPGHFQGVCQVVDRLLELVSPDVLYLGQKDFQQCMVVRRLLEITGRTLPELRIGETLREPDGLAMSSRNLRLTSASRTQATAIYRALENIRATFGQHRVEELEQAATAQLEAAGFVVDYVAIRRAEDLQPAVNGQEKKVALAAATINGVRLIDNLPLN